LFYVLSLADDKGNLIKTWAIRSLLNEISEVVYVDANLLVSDLPKEIKKEILNFERKK
jgi:hypothetical protein